MTEAIGNLSFGILPSLLCEVGYAPEPFQNSTPLSANGMFMIPGLPGGKLYIGTMKKWINREITNRIIKIPMKYAPNFCIPDTAVDDGLYAAVVSNVCL